MPPAPLSIRLLAAAVLATLVALCALVLPAAGQGTQASLSTKQSRAAALRAAVDAETARLGRTEASLAQAQQRLDAIVADANAKQARVRAVGAQIARTREELQTLENRMHRASVALRDNLVSAYEHPEPDLVSFLLRARSFGDLLESRDFLKRIQANNSRILDATRTTRIQVDAEAGRLVTLQAKAKRLADAVQQRQDEAEVARQAILNVRARQLARRDGTAAQLASVRAQIAGLQAQQRKEAARAARIRRSAVVSGIGVNTGGLAQPPAGAPAAVAKVMAAGNAIAGLPYVYGGGHGSFQASAYDCSGSVSYALAAAGLVSSPLDSTSFESWGQPGPGRWITVYANAGHAYMVVAGWRFDTSALSSGGTRWSRQLRDNVGFVARHPPGL